MVLHPTVESCNNYNYYSSLQLDEVPLRRRKLNRGGNFGGGERERGKEELFCQGKWKVHPESSWIYTPAHLLISSARILTIWIYRLIVRFMGGRNS